VAAISAAIEYHELYGQGTTIDEMYDSMEQCRQDSAILHVHPSNPRLTFFSALIRTTRPGTAATIGCMKSYERWESP